MGTIYKVSCSKCKYEQQFNLGAGLKSADFSWCIQLLNHKQKEKIDILCNQGNISRFRAINKLTKCRYCNGNGKLKETMIMELWDKMQNISVYGNFCDNCGKELEIYDETGIKQGEKVICPECGQGHLTFTQTGFWD